jgi:hypothetical protein
MTRSVSRLTCARTRDSHSRQRQGAASLVSLPLAESVKRRDTGWLEFSLHDAVFGPLRESREMAEARRAFGRWVSRRCPGGSGRSFPYM